ncbi:metal-sensitive transcriptional regulator [Aureimonas glaciei]|jgi:DNA-binding FrmR family transcriptional regulator|uniref:Transcriptional regulator n=1 Tax=Aureimonas glaciei TaxID=1776957 RepID=A0A916XZC0_9HYPH|nr:metal-sensitive transcriptional regulator [Aureimonas glaciei]GGD21386.1 transcriptional regulator [Aureimonas glaciei]
MPDGEIVDQKILLRRTEEEKRPILQRLKRIEGQVRGLQNMIAEDRYCLDEVQQINAVSAALREVALVVISQHVSCGIHMAGEDGQKEVAIDDVMRVLRAAMRASE